ncbi:hypothetical protein C2I06_16215 [Niallia circulans]|uniref:SGNH/GDSL hydrolase family protein n=1 Tax=Niallia circulans TaxID=1397 RepID=UPI000F45D885|nr:hypothetical protein [Niallia circulans]AYV68286.1 hypothetical protein C2I06_16215 [Niallia circulans]
MNKIFAGILLIVCIGLVIFYNQQSKEESIDMQNEELDVQIDKAKESNVATNESRQEDKSPSEKKENVSLSQEASINGKKITIIGDSVIVGAAPYLEKMLPGIVIDGKVSRQMNQANEVIDQLKAQGKLREEMVIELGTNGPFSQEILHDLLGSLNGLKHIYLVNTRVPKDWQDKVNSDLQEVAKGYKNVTVIDWYSASQGKEAYFGPDGVHLKPEGAEYYANLIVDALKAGK